MESTRPRVRLVVVAVVVAVVAAGAATVLGLTLTHGTNKTPAQLSSVETACRQWLRADQGLGGDEQWCTEMTGWMSQQMRHSGAGPQMMWGDADHMLSTCEQWMTTDPPSGVTNTPRAWCSAMVAWMAGHVHDWSGENQWSGWMMHGSMMGIRPDAV